MRKWPEVNKMVRPSSSRGGKNVSQENKNYSKVQIDVETEMPCGQQFKARERVRASVQYSTEDKMLKDIGNKARNHLRTCNKEKCVKAWG